MSTKSLYINRYILMVLFTVLRLKLRKQIMLSMRRAKRAHAHINFPSVTHIWIKQTTVRTAHAKYRNALSSQNISNASIYQIYNSNHSKLFEIRKIVRKIHDDILRVVKEEEKNSNNNNNYNINLHLCAGFWSRSIFREDTFCLLILLLPYSL